MSAKYEFVPGDTITIAPGRTLKRIRALATISVAGVAPGNLGGYVESETNLAQVSGDAWVSGNAQVSGNALVSGNAQVSGDAQVYGDARVYGDAQVYGNGFIFWASKVGAENGTLAVYNAKDNKLLVNRGCFLGTPEQFLAASANKHDARTQHEYKLLLEVATSRIEAARAALKETEEEA